MGHIILYGALSRVVFQMVLALSHMVLTLPARPGTAAPTLHGHRQPYIPSELLTLGITVAVPGRKNTLFIHNDLLGMVMLDSR